MGYVEISPSPGYGQRYMADALPGSVVARSSATPTILGAESNRGIKMDYN